MARKDALLRLHHRLLNQRDALRKKLYGGADLNDDGAGHGDLGDVANLDTELEIDSQLAAFESRELVRIEKALDAIREGRYGYCEICTKAIPIARLQVLPHTSCCVDCQRKHGDSRSGVGSEANWESVWELQARERDRELTPQDIRLDGDR
jgi:DnaK suppressor protein